MDICEKYLQDVEEALRDSISSKRDTVAAIRSYEGAAQCFENFGNFKRAAQCYVKTANLICKADPLKAARMFEKAAACMEKTETPQNEYCVQAAVIFKDCALRMNSKNSKRELYLLRKAAENFKKGGDIKAAAQCCEIGAESSLDQNDYLNALVFYGIAGQNFQQSKDYEKALQYYEKVANLWDQVNMPKNVAESYLKISNCLDKMGEFEYSIQFIEKGAKKYKDTGSSFESAKCYEKAAKRLEEKGNFLKSGEFYHQAADIMKSLKNTDKHVELSSKAAECYGKAGESLRAIEIHTLLATAFSKDPHLSNKHYEKAISFASGDPWLQAELLTDKAESLMRAREFVSAGQCFERIAGIQEELGEPYSEYYRRAGDAYVLFAEDMLHFENRTKAQEGFEKAASCYDIADKSENIERIHQYTDPNIGKREEQVNEELERLELDVKKGLLPEEHFLEMKEGYQKLLRQLRSNQCIESPISTQDHSKKFLESLSHAS